MRDAINLYGDSGALMPYTPKAHRFFEAVAHGMKPKNGSKLSQEKAKELASEGIKGKSKDKKNRKTLYGGDR